nr:ATP-binding cassette domain-containing protein [Cryptosporangium arvum]
MTERSAIEAHGLVKRFGTVRALDGLDVHVPIGEVLGLLGPNGAGKSTAVRILTTLLRPDAGTARILGHDVRDAPGQIRRLIGVSGQYVAVDAHLTGRENLRMIGRLSGLSRTDAKRRADHLLETFDLGSASGRTARTLSGGTRRRLDVAASLVAAPAVLFLDEPTTGLDPRGRTELWRLLDELRSSGTSLLLTTQYLEEADRLATRILVLHRGRAIATGSPEELKRQVGGDRLELRTLPGADPRALAAAVCDLGTGPPVIDAGTERVLLPVADGPGALLGVATRLAAADLRISDVALRRPTLDEVFFTLTGPGGPADRRPQ